MTPIGCRKKDHAQSYQLTSDCVSRLRAASASASATTSCSSSARATSVRRRASDALSSCAARASASCARSSHDASCSRSVACRQPPPGLRGGKHQAFKSYRDPISGKPRLNESCGGAKHQAFKSYSDLISGKPRLNDNEYDNEIMRKDTKNVLSKNDTTNIIQGHGYLHCHFAAPY